MMREALAILAVLSALVLGMPSAGPLSAAPVSAEVSPPAATAQQKAVVIPFHGDVDDYSKRSLLRHLNRARAEGAQVVVLEIDSYGGAVRSALEISHAIKQSGLKTIAYVNSKAYSAGALIAVACDELVMSPAGMIGDCAPIAVAPGRGLISMSETEREKAESPIRAEFRDSAVRNGYDPLLLESMVTLGRVVHYVEKDGMAKFVNADEYTALTKEGWASVGDVPNPVDSANTLLTLPADLTVKLGLAEFVASSREDLASKLNLNVVGSYELSAGHRLIEFLDSSVVRALLFTLFLTSLYVAFHLPGHGLAEVLATASLAVLLVVPMMTGYGQWWEVVAILIGVVLLAVEIFVLPGFGVAGLLGILLILGGFLMTFVAPEPGKSPISLPSLPVSWVSIQNGLMALTSGLVLSIVFSALLRRFLPKLPFARKMLLTSPVGASESAMVGSLNNIDPDDLNPALGANGIALTDLKPGGTAEFKDAGGQIHTVSVISDSGFVTRGTSVKVVETRGRVLVTPVVA